MDIIENVLNENPLKFKDLKEEYRRNPIYLKYALKAYKNNNLTDCNEIPINFAIDDAFTEENIALALSISTTYPVTSAVYQNKKFVLYALEKGCLAIEYILIESNPLLKDIDIAKRIVRHFPVYYGNLTYFLNNAEVLKIALDNYNGDGVNPLSYACEGALTNENINLAIKKGNIKIFPESDLSKNEYFVRIIIERKEYRREFINISPELLLSNPDIHHQISSIMGLEFVVKNVSGPKNTGKKKYKYDASSILIFPNGNLYEQPILNDANGIWHHLHAIRKIVVEYSQKENITDLLKDIEVIRRDQREQQSGMFGNYNPYPVAKKCSEYGICTLMIERETAQIYLPKTITMEQYNKLSEILPKDFEELEFELYYDGIDENNEIVEKGMTGNDSDEIDYKTVLSIIYIKFKVYTSTNNTPYTVPKKQS